MGQDGGDDGGRFGSAQADDTGQGRPHHEGAAGGARRGGLTQPWPEARVAELTGLWNGGLSSVEVAARMGLSRMAVESKLAKLRRAGRPLARRTGPRRSPPTRAMRRCLYCDHAFASEHVGNRICPACLVEGPFTSAMV